MADIHMNDFTAASDAAYVYGELANGSQVKINRNDLANSLNNILQCVRTYQLYGDLNAVDKTGVYMIFSGATNGPNGTQQGSILINLFWNIDTIKQMYFSYGEDVVYIRSKRGNIWSNWKSI